MKLKSMLAVIACLCATAGVAQGGEGETVAPPREEFALLTGYGITHPHIGSTRTRVQTWDLIARYGRYLSPQLADGTWYQGRPELLAELPYHMAVDRGGRSMAGGSLLGCWKFSGSEEFSPYVFFGVGLLYVDLGLPGMGSKLNFTYQGGIGLQYLLRRDIALTAEYRYHHISNAGTASANEALNSSKVLIGLSFFR